MGRRRRRLLRALYVTATVILPVALLHPAFVYLDLAGMGGYDGFASPEMMLEHGVWGEMGELTAAYRLYEAVYFLWLFSLLNVPVAVLLAVRSLLRGRPSPPGSGSTGHGAPR